MGHTHYVVREVANVDLLSYTQLGGSVAELTILVLAKDQAYVHAMLLFVSASEDRGQLR